jgi:hypothetical protein
MEDDKFVSDDEVTHFLNDEIQKLYSEMLNIDEGQLFATVSPTLTQIGANAYQLPSDFLRLVDVNVFTGSRWVPVYEGDAQDYLPLLTRTYSGRYDVQYYLKLNVAQGRYELFVFPAQDTDNIGVRYIQEHPVLSVGPDTLKWPSSWHRVPVLGAAIKCLVKEESDPSGLLLEYDRAQAQVLKDIRSQKVAEVQTLRQIAGKNRRRRSRRYPHN